MSSILSRYVPGHFRDPVGLVRRLVASRDGAAYYAMAFAAAGIALSPLDLALSPFERRRVRSADAPQQPLVLICGPPRSGTTVVSQTLVTHLNVAYFSNLTSLFPRSPLTALRLLGRATQRPDMSKSYYGRTKGLSGCNDALFLWDRWLGSDRVHAPLAITEHAKQEMQSFFTACSALFGLPLICKNNSLNASAHLVADCVPHARFLCLTRNPRDLARSLYRARNEIHGDPTMQYGMACNNAGTDADAESPMMTVCRQVEHYQRLQQTQQQRLGDQRFRVLSYESFCADPEATVQQVADEWLAGGRRAIEQAAQPFPVSQGKLLADELEEQLEAGLRELDLAL